MVLPQNWARTVYRKNELESAIEDSSIDLGDFFKGPLPGKFLKLLGYLALSRLGIYIPIGGINQEAFVGNLDQNSFLSTLDSLSGGGIGRLGICSLGIVPFINAQIVFQLLTQIFPKLQDLQKREGEAGRKKVLQYTRYASVGFAVVQAIGQVLYLRPYVNDFSTEWVLSSVTLLTVGSVLTTYIGEKISDLKLGNGTSLLIFTSIISYLPASFGRTVSQAFQDGNYIGLTTIVISFLILVLGIVYVQEAERKIPLNYASRYSSRSGGLQKAAYLPFKGSMELHSYSDADWAGDKDTRRSTSGYCSYLGNTLISWSVKKQHMVARSSTESEYRSLATALVDILWLRRLLTDFGIHGLPPTKLHCDSTSAIALANNPVFHARTKHIEIDHYFIRDHIQANSVQIFPISTKDQIADIFTKSISTPRFQYLCDKLTVQSCPSA